MTKETTLPCDLFFSFMMTDSGSGVARAFPGGQAAHPEDQNEEENEERLIRGKRREHTGK